MLAEIHLFYSLVVPNLYNLISNEKLTYSLNFSDFNVH